MTMLRVLLCYLLLGAASAFAITEQELTAEQMGMFTQDVEPLQVTGDAISWEVFAKTGQIEVCVPHEDGYEDCLIKPKYTTDTTDLNGQEVTLMGFMFPLEQTDAQSNFLIGPYPLSCPFHYHTGPSQIVEVFAKTPIDFSYDPITVKGTFSVRFNEETGVFYYLENAS